MAILGRRLARVGLSAIIEGSFHCVMEPMKIPTNVSLLKISPELIPRR
jgi:hypothetical protein